MKYSTVTVIIPTYKPDEKFAKLLARLEQQTVLPEQILIINTEKQYFKEEVLENIAHVKVCHISKNEFDHGGTRDMGARMADSDLCVFMTMDAMPADRHLLEKLIRPFADPMVGAAYARQLPAGDCSYLERCTREFNYGSQSRIKSKDDLETMGIKTFFCSDVCAAYRRSVYLEQGGFEKKTIFNEDMIFAGKLILADYKIAYCADAKVIHSHNYTGFQQLRRNFDLGVSQAEHPEIFGMAASESEGIRLVKQTAGKLLRAGKPWLMASLVWQSGCKYLGYRLGKQYKKLPGALIRRCSMNPGYWIEKDTQF